MGLRRGKAPSSWDATTGMAFKKRGFRDFDERVVEEGGF